MCFKSTCILIYFIGTVEFVPIHFMHRSLPFDELTALYAASDVCLVSSTRDGMNLVSYEYIASQKDTHGVLILSEFAGAAQSLNGSIIVNPWNTEEMANAIYEAVTMPDDVRKANHQKLYRYVTKYTAAYWGLSFVNELRVSPFITWKMILYSYTFISISVSVKNLDIACLSLNSVSTML